MEKVLLSIIVPVYNVEKYIRKCIDSILEQDFKYYEIILVDDGSTDNSGYICDEYKMKNDCIRVIHQENAGLSSARNSGLKVANGEYIGFVDSDDWINKNMYRKLYDLITANNADIAQCSFKKIFDEVDVNNDNHISDIKLINNIEALNNLYSKNYVESVVSWNKIYKKSLFNDVIFPDGKIHEDEFTTYKLLYKCEKIVLTDEQLYYYRQTPNSIMNSSFNEKRLDFLLACKQAVEFYEKIENANLYYKSLIRYECNLRSYYIKCDKLTTNKDSCRKLIRKNHKEIIKKFIMLSSIGVGKKAISCIFLLNPNFASWIVKIKKGIS